MHDHMDAAFSACTFFTVIVSQRRDFIKGPMKNAEIILADIPSVVEKQEHHFYMQAQAGDVYIYMCLWHRKIPSCK